MMKKKKKREEKRDESAIRVINKKKRPSRLFFWLFVFAHGFLRSFFAQSRSG